jgi:hypothetical protein
MRSTANYPWLNLHRHLATMHYWQERLLWCGLGALALSLLAWLLGAHFSWHLVFIAVGAALGFLKPLPPGQGWALHWLDTHAGLSYRTALEIERDEDPYGFYPAVHRRVERVSKNIERPSPQPWWLPLFALAFGLLLLPNVPWASLSPLSTQPSLPGAEAPPLADDAEDLGDEADAHEEPQDGEESGLAEGLDEQGEESGLDANGPEGERSFDGSRAPESDTPLDREALDNFLRDLEGEDGADEAGDPEARPGGDEEAGEREAPAQPREAREGDAGNDEDQEGEEGTAQERGEGEEGQPGRQEGEEADGEAAGSEEGEQADGEEEGEDGAVGGEEGAEGEEGLGEDEGGDERGASPDGAGGDEEGLGEDDGDLDGEGAGARGMEAETEGLHEELEREEERLEFVPGQREEGPSASSGTIRMPGAGEAEGPAGASPEEFERSLERAITEGRIPVEYQEVLRDYFR